MNTFTDDDARWQAIVKRDEEADGQFIFAVLTTGIFCRPSCRARHALRQNVRFYDDAIAAAAAGFRPCKRCQPDKQHPRQQLLDKIAHACRLLEQESPITLDQLAQAVAISPYHLHRQFKSVTGMTPKAWQRSFRARRLRTLLAQGAPVTDALLNAGYPDASSYYRQADASLGMTARQYRRGEANVRYTLGSCELGRCLVAESERGVCAVLLGDSDAGLTAELRLQFPQAQQAGEDEAFAGRVAQVIRSLDDTRVPLSLPLDIRGSAFQSRVWQALRAIPVGTTASYAEVAAAMGQPNAVRAVARACAANTLAIIVPCHRVIRSDGGLSGYRWGSERKAQLLQREARTKED